MKQEVLISKLSEVTGFTKKDVKVMLDGLDKTIFELVDDLKVNFPNKKNEDGKKEKKDTITLGKLVTFEVIHKDEANRRNPQTGEEIISPAHNEVKVKIRKELKNKFNK